MAPDEADPLLATELSHPPLADLVAGPLELIGEEPVADLGVLGVQVDQRVRIHRCTDSTDTSKSAATSARVRSPRRATVTTSRLNSGGNFLGISTSFPPDTAGRKRCQPDPRQTLDLLMALRAPAWRNG
jgi:hypothetical protein